MQSEIAAELVSALESRDVEALSELCADDAVVHHPLSPEPVRGKTAIRASEQVLFDAFSDIDVSIVRVLAQAEDVALEVVLRATNTGPLDVGGEEPLPPTGRRTELPAVWFLRLDSNGKIVEERDYFDTANFFRQLGLGDT